MYNSFHLSVNVLSHAGQRESFFEDISPLIQEAISYSCSEHVHCCNHIHTFRCLVCPGMCTKVYWWSEFHGHC